MLHLDHIDDESKANQELLKRASGRFYTGEPVGRQLAAGVALALAASAGSDPTCIRLIDPFGGDGRLVAWLIESCIEVGMVSLSWNVELWDLSDVGFAEAQRRVAALTASGVSIEFRTFVGDAFGEAVTREASFDIVITNPPWELLKPDRRELERLNGGSTAYVEAMRAYDHWIGSTYPLSQPRRKFAGWGTNLSRVGLEVGLRLTRPLGVLGVVMPASLLADDQSTELRRHLLTNHRLLNVAYYPAEAKHYGTADVASITLVARVQAAPADVVPIATAGCSSDLQTSEVRLDPQQLRATDYVLPVAFGAAAVRILGKLSASMPTWSDLEALGDGGFWAGREVDETGCTKWLVDLTSGGAPFLKGRMIERFRVREKPSQAVGKASWSPPPSTGFERIAWRDVSRPNQKRRVIATIVPAGWALGNSLGVAYFADGGPDALRALLGVMSSTVFEFQLRAHLATGHVSLSSLRKVVVPSFADLESDRTLQDLVAAALRGDSSAEVAADAHVARHCYKLSRDEYATVLDLFPKLEREEKDAYVTAYGEFMMASESVARETSSEDGGDMVHSEVLPSSGTIYNHFSARLSDLDMRMVRAVPEGGNWKDIPESIPSRRLEQIRESYARGEGSRSTYYGRLRRDMPSYTINTYFNRPGNGCHVHPTQDRVLSQREAARLQSFPDDFEFLGTQGDICTQIGNAVPPLLAFQIARTLGHPGAYIDLFCGAGGMGLGFRWAGWRPVIANDLEPRFVETYRRNVHGEAVAGSITDPETMERLVEAAGRARRPGEPFWVLGGPPCQGFSTAGNKRTMEDPRNHLVWDYVRFLDRVRPDGFVFENVTGLLNMQGGKVFAAVKEAFSSVMPSLDGAVLAADDYAIPQRRKRVVLVGRRERKATPWAPPQVLTSTSPAAPTLFRSVQQAISVHQALSDLPPLGPGENGSDKGYISSPVTPYQALMRGRLTPEEYLGMVSAGVRAMKPS
jgi:Alw26I/Eco31I/Esp3I family type II restriction m6 adenine DNA methyltransferase